MARTTTAPPAPIITDRFGPYSMQEIATALSLADTAARQMLITGGPFDQDDFTGIGNTAAGLAGKIFGKTASSAHDDHVSCESYDASVFAAYLLGLSMGALSGAFVPSMVAAVAAAKGGR